MADPFERLKRTLAYRYAIEHELGRRGMATVYRAHDLEQDLSPSRYWSLSSPVRSGPMENFVYMPANRR